MNMMLAAWLCNRRYFLSVLYFLGGFDDFLKPVAALSANKILDGEILGGETLDGSYRL
jgi:hypothetical protein